LVKLAQGADACIAKLAAIQSIATGKRVNIHLTLIGQGVFKNRQEVINSALAEIYKYINGFNIKLYIHAFKDFDFIIAKQSLKNNNIFYSEMTNEEFFRQ